MEQTILFNKERSIKACVADGWRIPALGWKRYLSAFWAQLLFFSAAVAFLLEISVQYLCDHALPAYILSETGGDPLIVRWIATPSIPVGLYWGLALLLCVFGGACFYARILRIIRLYRTLSTLPGKLSIVMDREEFKTAQQIILVTIITLFVFSFVSVPFLLCALKWNMWILIAPAIIGIYLWASANLAILKYALFDNSLKTSITYALKHGFGLSVILQFITLLPAAFAACVFWSPALLYVCTSIVGAKSVLMGDAAGLPVYLPVLFFILNVVCFGIYKIVGTLRIWTLSLKVA